MTNDRSLDTERSRYRWDRHDSRFSRPSPRAHSEWMGPYKRQELGSDPEPALREGKEDMSDYVSLSSCFFGGSFSLSVATHG